MPNLTTLLQNRLENAKKIAVLAIGSELRGDDYAGIAVAKALEKKLKKKRTRPQIKTFIGSTAPENLTGEVKKFKPSHLLIIDAAETGEKSGTVILLKPEDINELAMFSTHKIPINVLVRYLSGSLKCKTIIIGIQPASIKFGKTSSRVVMKSAEGVAQAIYLASAGIK
ncbi:MAG: hypothetical protein COS99_05160 [Candidatus Omnitrophica bacterium CG07_land_8_20_14_0_80_42_15]|uniref:Hydrogenase maturation peptidase HycI n=1 Tax=Candidatus Aquitaenariimonas noxiae TaxID=1974741 RepID=A0A2J0L2M2_9BACT|nr:MAG: hypothetical protein COS99_05160 [Candidatus Omnitrophica bacterium CG07_land_8_20_14_0_80_42_15]